MNNLKLEQLLKAWNGCNYEPPCPDHSDPTPDYNCGEFQFCGNVELHYNVHPGTYTIYEEVNGTWCTHGSINDDTNSGCEGSIKFPDKKAYKIEWCVEVGYPVPVFSTTPLTGFKPYFAEFSGIKKPEVHCYNSFTVCVPPCCSVRVKTDAGEFTMHKMEQGYCRGFGTFDGTLSYIELDGTVECIRKTKVAVQLASPGSPPPVVTISPELPNIPCGTHANQSNAALEIVCFRRNSDSIVETGFMLIEVLPNGNISKKLFDELDVAVTDYTLINCC